jgi:hypothetical protein
MSRKSRSQGGSNQPGGRGARGRERRARVDAKAEELVMTDERVTPEHKLLDALDLLREYIEKVDGSSHLRNAQSNIEAHLYEKGTLKRPQ